MFQLKVLVNIFMRNFFGQLVYFMCVLDWEGGSESLELIIVARLSGLDSDHWYCQDIREVTTTTNLIPLYHCPRNNTNNTGGRVQTPELHSSPPDCQSLIIGVTTGLFLSPLTEYSPQLRLDHNWTWLSFSGARSMRLRYSPLKTRLWQLPGWWQFFWVHLCSLVPSIFTQFWVP